MTGQYQHSLDAKGRLFIPARLREELGDVFYVCRGQDGCLSVFSGENWERFLESLKNRPYSEVKKLRSFFASTDKCTPDAQGRILISQGLRAYAGIEKETVVIGIANRAEIWSAERWAAEQAKADDDLAVDGALAALDMF